MAHNSKRGKRLTFHGAFKSKAKAKKREREHSGFFILETAIRGRKRYEVVSKNK
jgi:hypothetical protein